MGYINSLPDSAALRDSRGRLGLKGQKARREHKGQGDPGTGFKLASDGNFVIERKKDDSLAITAKDFYSGVNKGCVNENFLKKDGFNFDLKGSNIKNGEPYYDGLYEDHKQSIVAGKSIITSAVAGGITLNPVVLASLTGFGLVVKAVAGLKKYDKKAEKANFARVEYKKSLMRLDFISGANLLTKKPFSTS